MVTTVAMFVFSTAKCFLGVANQLLQGLHNFIHVVTICASYKVCHIQDIKISLLQTLSDELQYHCGWTICEYSPGSSSLISGPPFAIDIPALRYLGT
jgi:hypothetical protein